MKAVIIRKFGGRDVLELADIPTPVAQPGEVLLRIKAAGVNPVDYKIRAGLLKDRMPYVFPIVPGWDAAGVIEELGEGVTDFQVGDEVLAYCRKESIQDGTYAEYITVEPKHLAPKPDNLSFEEAAAIPLAGLTAFQCLFESIQLKKGEVILIHAGAGGVGAYAIQLAKNVGATVLTTCGPQNKEYVHAVGADTIIDYSTEDFVQATIRLYPKGIDAVFDTVGGDVQVKSAQVLKKDGRLTSILALDEAALKKFPVKLGYVFVRPEPNQLRQLGELAQTGRLRVHLDAVLPLSSADKAHERMESRHGRGKVVLKID